MILRDFHKKNTHFSGCSGWSGGVICVAIETNLWELNHLGLISGRSSSLNSAVVNEKPADAPVGSLKAPLVICWNIDVDHFRVLSLEYQKRKGMNLTCQAVCI